MNQRSINFFPHENFQNARAEVYPPGSVHFRKDVLQGPVPLVGSQARHGIESIGNSDDPRLKGNGFSRQTIRISFSVKLFMVMTNHGDVIIEKLNPFHYLYADQRMLPNRLRLFGAESCRFPENLIFDANLADILEEGSGFQNLD